MSRYDFDQEPDEMRNEAVRPPQTPSSRDESLSLRGQGCGTGDDKTGQEHERGIDVRCNDSREHDVRLEAKERLEERRNRGHEPKHNLRDSEVETLADLGTFRIVKRDDLVTYRYGGDHQKRGARSQSPCGTRLGPAASYLSGTRDLSHAQS